jgi:cyclopropane fatty-acyl-phospholipid synthase-like methyltransferase
MPTEDYEDYFHFSSAEIAMMDHDVGSLGTKLHVKSRLPMKGKVLEIGPGHGTLVKELILDKNYDVDVTVLDLSKSTTKFVKSRFGEQVSVMC